MASFGVRSEVFDRLPHLCIAVVVARGMRNSDVAPAVTTRLAAVAAAAGAELAGGRVKESDDVAPYRAAFTELGINPNKFLCSIEALLTRIVKSRVMPSITPIVDAGNSVSITHRVPIGAHDMDSFDGDLWVREAEDSDTFLPFGGETPERPDAGEIVYASGAEVRTRRWIWRQSDLGKISPESTNVMFPIDGFAHLNEERLRAAQCELAELVRSELGATVTLGWIDREHPVLDLG